MDKKGELYYMENELVRYSRAGDVFHYRWAARRCLRMIYPKSLLRYMIIEASEEKGLAGEYVIDVTEYSDSAEKDSLEIVYFQLKHTTVRSEQHFNLSDLRGTIEGFAKRYSEHFCIGNEIANHPKVTFSIVTNRPISKTFKQNVLTIGETGKGSRHYKKILEKYTNLKNEHLKKFCASLEFADGEGDYNSQRHELHAEISQLLAGTVDNPIIDGITALVQNKALPDSNGKIVREEILRYFGVTSGRDLYPAPPEFEKLNNTITRKQHESLLNSILFASTPLIVHAAGGVGKSVFARQIAQSLPVGSLGIVYDCFGGGRYRNRSEPRHHHRDAFIQIANELAAHGLCDPLLAPSTASEADITRQFLARIQMAVKALRNTHGNAILAILVDAADNAEMAAEEFGQPCFVHELLRERLPEGCRLVALCRTERIYLLQPSSTIAQLELEPFSEEETVVHFRNSFPSATGAEGQEFHRLTTGNPRVQANALSVGFNTIAEVLVSLGPSGTTVEKQIKAQLDSAVSAVKDKLSPDYQGYIDSICFGLATLPPFIPIHVLAKAAGVNEAEVRSFVSDLGRPVWLSDTSVQFRDEPTETWFRLKFSATSEQITAYITRLMPLANEYSYVAETLPSLLLQARKYKELINLALSDELLPQNPIDERNVRVYRLQFAFKAALKLKRNADAMKLALRAGEEVAGDQRQIQLLTKNVDLIAPLQNEQKVQELAFRRMLRSGWDGSENVYSASLLSSVEDFKGEARGYLRSAKNWLRIYFEEHKKSNEEFQQERLKDEDIVELTHAYFNLFGTGKTIDFILSWHPPDVVYRIAKKFFRRLIDIGNFGAITEISLIDSRSQYLMLALVHELIEVGHFPRAESLEQCLDMLTTSRARIPKPVDSYNDTILSSIVAFSEACAARKLAKEKILRVLRHYIPIRASRSVSSHYQKRDRDTYLRAIALKSVLSGCLEPSLEELIPEGFIKGKQKSEQDLREFKTIVGALLPWYIARARVLVHDGDDIFELVKNASSHSKNVHNQRWSDSDFIAFEISRILIDILIIYRKPDPLFVKEFFAGYLKDNQQMIIQDRLKLVRAAFRLRHLSEIKRLLEESVHKVIDSALTEGPETRAEWYIDLARAVLPVSRDDAAIYFDFAVQAVSKFGDEIIERWEAVVALANRSADGGHGTPEIAYRFIRCAELVGDHVEREKHFGRNRAIRTCVRLSPASAMAALSRWRDRDVGWFNRQLPALAEEMVVSKYLSPSVGWSLSVFFEEYGLDDFASLCLEREPSITYQKYILNTAIRDIRVAESPDENLQKLKKFNDQHSIGNKELDGILAVYSGNSTKERGEMTQNNSFLINQEEPEPTNWEELFVGLDLISHLGISQAIQRFDAVSALRHNHKEFWGEVYSRIDESDALRFLNGLIITENVDMYDMKEALDYVPEDWRSKVSVKQNWGKILNLVARRFASQFTERGTLAFFVKDLQAENEIISIQTGILEGLSDNSDLVNSSTFFGFVRMCAPLVSPEHASELLDFALNRFEMHLNDNYADGAWSSWLMPPEDMSMAFAGFVWASLGSPRSKTRWQAAHCVRRLADANCEPEINALVKWMEQDEIGAFGSHHYPFYNLHARLYLMIALARVSIDIPKILESHHITFSQIALGTMAHILIQKFSSEIALNIEKAFPNTYDNDVVVRLHRVGVSQLPIKEMDSYKGNLASYWHIQGEVDTSLKFYHGYDFDRYWFGPLGDVFGISEKQVEGLATEVVINEWGIRTAEEYPRDPRAGLWNSQRNERETWHDHGSYPRIDNYSFYLSYHAMFVVAAKMLEKMSVVHRRDWYDNEWTEWLHRHSLTQKDGSWLADRRDPVPVTHQEWMRQTQTENWRIDITNADFLDGLLAERSGETWLNVFGSWAAGDSGREESFYVTSALVSPVGSQSLLHALTTCPNPHDFKLPDYQEEEMEVGSYPFELQGWIWKEDTAKRIDDFDPFAAQIHFPPYLIGESIVEILELSLDSEQRVWSLLNTGKPSAICEIWSTGQPEPNKEPLKYGNRLSASLSILKKLCVVLDCELIIEIQIDRNFKRQLYSGRENEGAYTPPRNKIFIFSADGKFRDAESYYQLG